MKVLLDSFYLNGHTLDHAQLICNGTRQFFTTISCEWSGLLRDKKSYLDKSFYSKSEIGK